MADYLEELVQKITTRADLKGFDDLDRKQRRAIKTNDILGQSFRRAFGIFFGIQGVRSIIQTSRQFDLLQRSISGLTGSTQDWEYLRKEADRTGSSLTQIAGSYKNFYSAAKMSGFDRSGIQTMFSDVLTAGRGIGASQEQVRSALVALEQMLSKGKVSAQELRLQMGNALPGSFEIAAKAMGLTTRQLDEMMSKGELLANDFLPKFTKELRNTYEKGFAANVHSLDAELVRLSNAWQEFQANILQGEAGEALAQLVRDITSILRSQELLNFIKLIGKALEFVIKNIKLIILLFGAKKIIEWTQTIIKLHNAILLAANSTAKLGTATRTLATGYMLMTNGQIITGLRMLSAGLWAMVKPIATASLAMAGLVSWFLILQDLWLFFTDPNADTMTRRIMEGVKDIKEDKNNLAKQVIKPLTDEEKDKAESALGIQGKHLNTRKNKSGTWDVIGIEDNLYSAPGRPEPFINKRGDIVTGGAAPIVDADTPIMPNQSIIDTNIKTPDNGYVGILPNLTGEYQSSKSQTTSNNITININAPNSQPETIAQSVEDALANFFNTYKVSYA